MVKLKRLKILPLCPLFIALIGCGKKVAENKVVEQGQSGVQTSPEITLESSLEGSDRSNAVFTIPRSGDVYLTPTIAAPEGQAVGYTLKVYVNRTAQSWEFYCQYKGVTNSSFNQYTLTRCYDIDGLDLGLSPSNIALYSFPLDQGKTIEMSIAGPASSTKTTARATFKAEWR